MTKKQFQQALQKYFSRRGQSAWAARSRVVSERRAALRGHVDPQRLKDLTLEARHYEECAIALWYEAGRVGKMTADEVWMEFWDDGREDVSATAD